jgi:putative sterol carrier protein
MASVREFFEALETQVDQSRTAGMNNTFLFDIAGAGKWTVSLDEGKVSVTEGEAGDPDCTITSSQENFERIVDGDLNPTSAYMTGKLKVKGDLGAAMKLQKLF